MIGRLRALLLAALCGLGMNAQAHEMSMAEMEVRATGPADFLWQWTAGNRDVSHELAPVWPAQCRADGSALRCAGPGLSGTLSVDGVGQRYSAAIVKIFWADGTVSVHTLTGAQPEVTLYGSAQDRRGMRQIAKAYVVLGVEHILMGVDHLLFVAALLFLVGFRRRLVLTITAFTLAHSLTLASSALGWLTLRSPPVEATIALSILLVAHEALHDRQTLSRRWPALVAFLFGLVHGLGFAGALQQIGLPEHHLFVALLTFNLGVEIGQLFAVGAAFLLWRAVSGLPRFRALRPAALYGIGAVAAYWMLERTAGLISSSLA